MGEARLRNQFMAEHGIQPRAQQVQPGVQQVRIDTSKSPAKACSCGCVHFTPVVSVHIVSALISPTGQELVAQVPVLVCLDCKEPLSMGK